MGIVKYETEEAYKKAMEEMNNFEYEGRKLTVRKFGSYSQDFCHVFSLTPSTKFNFLAKTNK